MNWKLYEGDCLEIMPLEIEDRSIDMILCDPPYGVTNNEKDSIIDINRMWKEYERIIKDNGAILIFAQGRFFIKIVNSNLKLFRYDLIWDKILPTGFLNANRMPLRSHEQIAVFYENLPTFNPQYTKGNPLHGKGTAYKNKELKNQNYGDFDKTEDLRKGSTQKYPKSIIKFEKPHPSLSLHPTQKPVEICEYLVRTYTNAEDLVLDNCAGSGTTGVACWNSSRNTILIEKEPEYCQVIKDRMVEVTSQKKLY
jgi:site-specific DNA-methyltransferase (adenine-specific)